MLDKRLIQHEEAGQEATTTLWALWGFRDNFCKSLSHKEFHFSFCRKVADHELPSSNHAYPQVFPKVSLGALSLSWPNCPEEKRGREKTKQKASAPASLSSQERGLFSWTLRRSLLFQTEEELWVRSRATKNHCSDERQEVGAQLSVSPLPCSQGSKTFSG